MPACHVHFLPLDRRSNREMEHQRRHKGPVVERKGRPSRQEFCRGLWPPTAPAFVSYESWMQSCVALKRSPEPWAGELNVHISCSFSLCRERQTQSGKSPMDKNHSLPGRVSSIRLPWAWGCNYDLMELRFVMSFSFISCKLSGNACVSIPRGNWRIH